MRATRARSASLAAAGKGSAEPAQAQPQAQMQQSEDIRQLTRASAPRAGEHKSLQPAASLDGAGLDRHNDLSAPRRSGRLVDLAVTDGAAAAAPAPASAPAPAPAPARAPAPAQIFPLPTPVVKKAKPAAKSTRMAKAAKAEPAQRAKRARVVGPGRAHPQRAAGGSAAALDGLVPSAPILLGSSSDDSDFVADSDTDEDSSSEDGLPVGQQVSELPDAEDMARDEVCLV